MPSSTNKHLGPNGHRDRLRQRFVKSGRSALADYELLELLLTYVIPRIDTKPIAKSLLYQFGTLFNVLQQPYDRLVKVKGIGPKSALMFKVVHAFMTRSEESAIENREFISGPEDIFSYVRLHLGAWDREYVYAIYLNNAKQVVHHCEVASGTIDRTAIYPREILKPALMVDAANIVLMHNHPDGTPVPSEADHQLTKQVETIAETMGIRLVDHIIVTRTQVYSLKTGKLL